MIERLFPSLLCGNLPGLYPAFNRMYSHAGRPSIPPEPILKSLLLSALYSVRSERQFCVQLDHKVLFRWFLEMNLTEEGFHATVFSNNRERLMDHEVRRLFFDAVVKQAGAGNIMRDDHFTVDGDLIEAWASVKSLRPKGEIHSDLPTDGDRGNPAMGFRGEKRTNQTDNSTTDPESRFMRKKFGKEAKLCYAAHALTKNRNGRLVDLKVSSATGKAEEEAAQEMLKRQARGGVKPKTLGADKGYDLSEFVGMLGGRKITPHVAANKERRGGSTIEGRTTRHDGHSLNQRIRKRVEEIFGCMKTIGGFRKTRFKGIHETQLAAWVVGSAYNLLRMARLLPERTEV